MSAIVSDKLKTGWGQPDQNLRDRITPTDFESYQDLSASITKAASKQTYYTIRFLVDRDRVTDAYRAYAYFRWVDDCLDERLWGQAEQIAFAERQQTLVRYGYQGQWPRDLTPEEYMLVDLIQSDQEPNSSLQAYIQHMMAVMVFDAHRRGRLISQHELDDYTRHLSIGVTEAMHYFIGHSDPSPHGEARYLAVTGAHITHMLRDTLEDVTAGYFNIPQEFLELHGVDPGDVQCDAYREWVKSRVQLARASFAAGRSYLAQVRSRRCRIAGYAYMARFQGVLDAIERADYWLRPAFPESKRLGAALKMGSAVLTGLFGPTASNKLATP